jgi:hypothetical protein
MQLQVIQIHSTLFQISIPINLCHQKTHLIIIGIALKYKRGVFIGFNLNIHLVDNVILLVGFEEGGLEFVL